MYRKLILAGAMTAAFTAPAFAEWNVLKAVPGPSGSESACLVVERTAAATGETLIAGPFASETEANAALEAAPACANRNTDSDQNRAGPDNGGSGSAPN
jgi:hypothetical protein